MTYLDRILYDNHKDIFIINSILYVIDQLKMHPQYHFILILR